MTKNIKFIATQVDPEMQQPPLAMDGMDDIRMQEVLILEGRNFHSGNDDLYEFADRFMYDADDFLQIIDESETAEEAVREMSACFDLSSTYGKDYKPKKELIYWKAALKKVDELDSSPIPYILTCLTGRKYERTTIRGCGQSDWAELVYPAGWTNADVDRFASEYFNTGTEWSVAPVDDSNDTVSIYTSEWDEDAKTEIAEYFEVKPEEVQLNILTGYERIPQYRVA